MHISRRIYLPHAVSLNGVSQERIRHYGYPYERKLRAQIKSMRKGALK